MVGGGGGGGQRKESKATLSFSAFVMISAGNIDADTQIFLHDGTH